jgi:hypothetical protein
MIEICFIARWAFRIYRKYLILGGDNSLWKRWPGDNREINMARRKPRFRAEKEARRRARLAAGPPQPVRVITDKRKKPVKHKKLLVEEA